jgi:arsenate reductase
MTHDDSRSPGSRPPPGAGSAPRDGLLFVCDGSAAHSQMAEAFARYIGPSHMRYYSASSRAGPIRPEASKVMRELGMDIGSARVKRLDEIPFDTVATIITLCPEERCPALPAGIAHLSWPMSAPADQVGEDETLVDGFRRVRDEIRELVSRLF